MAHKHQAAINLLREWANGNLTSLINPNTGICDNLKQTCLGTYRTIDIKTVMREWPKSTGCRIYPIPNPAIPLTINQFEDSAEAFEIFNTSTPEEMWETGPYAKLRRELCTYLADRIEKGHT